MPNRWRRRAALPNVILAWAALAAAALLAAGCTSSSAADQPGANGTIIAVGAENEYADVIAQVGGKYVQASAISGLLISTVPGYVLQLALLGPAAVNTVPDAARALGYAKTP